MQRVFNKLLMPFVACIQFIQVSGRWVPQILQDTQDAGQERPDRLRHEPWMTLHVHWTPSGLQASFVPQRRVNTISESSFADHRLALFELAVKPVEKTNGANWRWSAVAPE